MVRQMVCLAMFVSLVATAAGQEGSVGSQAGPATSVPPVAAPAAPMPAENEQEQDALQYVVEVKLFEGPGLQAVVEPVGGDPSAPGAGDRHRGKTEVWGQRLWDCRPDESSEIRLLTSPTLMVVANHVATVHVGGTRIFTYLEPIGDETFRAKRTEPIELGLQLSVCVRPFGDDPQIVELSPLQLAMSVLEGREVVEGLAGELNVGKPIVAEKLLKPSAVRLRLGEVFALAALGQPKNQVVMLVRVDRPSPKPATPR